MNNQNQLPPMLNDKTYTYAGFWIRFVAQIIDQIVLAMVTLPLGYMIYGNAYFNSDATYLGIADVIITTVLPSIAIIYLWLKYSATPGKMIFNLKVLDEKTGNPITLKQSIIRYFGYIVSTIFIFIGFIWAGFDKKKQSWHDKMAKTVVVKESL